MDETQRLEDSFLDDVFELEGDQARKPLAKLRVFKNERIPETELPLYLGENVMGRDPTSCSLPLDARSVSKRHAVICLSVFPGDRIHAGPVVEALVWDLGSMNGTRKGRFRLTPHVRYALSDGDSVVLADLPCQFVDTSEVLREGSAEPKKVIGGRKLPAKGMGRSLRTRAGKESESAEGGWSAGLKNTSLKGNGKGGRAGNETVAPSEAKSSSSLSLAPTPARPENLHVLELDSDSDDNTKARNGPTCSAFLSPMDSIVPESEDENSVTPSSSVKDSSHQRMTRGRKDPATAERMPKLVYDGDSEFAESETLRTEDRSTRLEDTAYEREGLLEGMAVDAVPNGRARPSEDVGMSKSEAGPSPDMQQPCKPGNQVSSAGENHTPEGEGEHKGPPQGSDPGSSGNNDPNKLSIQDGPSTSKQSFSVDSDTDVDGEEGAEEVLGPVSGAEATDETCTSPITSVVQPEEFHLDSDTDIEDNVDNAPMSLSRISLNAKPLSTTVVVTAEFHLDSDTDSKGSEDSPGERVLQHPKSSTGVTEPVLVKCPGLHLSSDTDGEDADGDPFSTSVRETREKHGTQQPSGGREVDLKIDSGSDSDVESSATQLFASTSKPELGFLRHQPASHSSPARGSARGCSSDSDTDVEEPGSVRPGPGPHRPARENVHLCLESDTDVEDGGEDGAADAEGGVDVSPVIAGVQEMDTQVFISVADPFRRPPIPPAVPSRPSEGNQDDLKDDDFFIAETQSFVSEAPGGSGAGDTAAKQPCVLSSPPSSESSSPSGFEEQPTMAYSFQLGLSDSGHERPGSSSRPAPLGLVAEDELCATQAYAADTVPLNSGPVEMDGDLEATQAFMMESAGEADRAVQISADDIMNIQEVGEEEEDHQRDFQANSHLSTADTQPVSVLEAVGVAGLAPEDEDEEGVKRTLRGQRGARRDKEEDMQPGRSTRSQRRGAVDQEPAKRERRMISKAGGTQKGKGSRQKAVLDEDVESDVKEDESVQEMSRGTRRTRERKSQKAAKDGPMMSRRTVRDEGDEERGEEREISEGEDGKKFERKRKEQEEREEREKLEKERKEWEEKEERERLEKERKEQKEREEREKLEKERKEQEEREERERLEKERKEQEERQEREKLEKERKEQEERQEREKLEKERKEQEEREERERLEKERKEREEREERERLEKERKEREEREERERLEKEREERERLEKERKEQEEREERERLEKERKEQEEREERERLEKERKEQEEREERERLEKERKEREEREERKRLEKEERERLEKGQERKKNVRKGKERHGEQLKEDDEEDEMKGKKIERKSARGKRKREQVCKEEEKDEEEEGVEEEQRRSSRARGKVSRRSAAVSANEPGPCDNDTAMPEPELRRGARPRSRYSSVTAVSSERSTSSTGTQERSRLRKGQKENSQSGYTRSNTTKGADTEDKRIDPNPAKQSQISDKDVPGLSMNDGRDFKGGTASTRADQSIEDSETGGGEVLPPRSKSQSRSQNQDLKGVLDEGEQTNSFKVSTDRQKCQRGGRRRGEELEEDEMGEKRVEEEIPQPSVRKVKSGAAQTKKMKQEEREEAQGGQKEEEDSIGSVLRKSRGRQTIAQRKKESQVEMSEELETKNEALDPNFEQDGHDGANTEVPQTPVGRGSRKRVASGKSPLAVKTPRHTSVQATSPAILSGSLQAPKVLFTCVTDESGEAVLSRLGGSLARGVADMTLLVTDRVRRTVKFLCAVARGIPVVTPSWLEKCSKNGAFLSPQAFLVKDVEQERKFNFCLEETLQTACAQPLLQGYEIHVTRSVKPDPAQMKDIITCSGARYLPRMPTVLKPQTVVISCAEDAALCGPALAASIPVLTAEFLLTGILQQKVDLVSHSLVGPGFGAPGNETPKGRRKR